MPKTEPPAEALVSQIDDVIRRLQSLPPETGPTDPVGRALLESMSMIQVTFNAIKTALTPEDMPALTQRFNEMNA